MNAQTYLADKSRTWELFDQKVSQHYDTLSDVISFGLYRGWRKALTRELPAASDLKILDLATGTGAIPLSILDNCGEKVSRIVGVDLSREMMAVFESRLQGHPQAHKVSTEYGDATALTQSEGQFDVVTMGCGIRNVGDHQN